MAQLVKAPVFRPPPCQGWPTSDVPQEVERNPANLDSPLPPLSPEDLVQMPLTPPSSHGSDSDGSQSPRSLPPSSPVRPMARSSTAISTSPLLTAPHVSSWGWADPRGKGLS